jgi:hypothetical protein
MLKSITRNILKYNVYGSKYVIIYNLNAGQVSRMLETENIAEYGPGTFISKTL